MKNISIIGMSMDLGQSRRGVDMGPSAIRYAGAVERLETLDKLVTDLGDISVDRPLDSASDESGVKNLTQVKAVNENLAEIVDTEVHNGQFPLIFGGDHSLAIGSIAGISKHYENLGVIWYDAHGDLNTEQTSPSGNIHGMPLAVNMGLGNEALTSVHGDHPKIKPQNIVIIGARDLDPGEKNLIRQKGIKIYTMHEVDRLGMPQVMDETLDYLKERTDGLHLSLDLDGLDPEEAPGVGTPVIGGLSFRESNLAMEMLHESNMVTSAECVEVNPILDEKNKTASVAVGLLASLCGETLK